MAHEKNHDYHILHPSAWPLLGALAGFILLFGAVLYFHDVTPFVMIIGFLFTFYVMFGWWAEVVKESHIGDHTPVVKIGLRYGVVLFITSEVMFFSAWFWTFFKHAMYPMEEYIGSTYTQPHIYPVNAFDLPLINTLILLCSGMAVTWAHHALVHENNRKDVEHGLLIAVILGVFFTVLQGYEYRELLLHHDWTFGGDEFFSNFFMATGFHGFHVIIGTIFLFVCYLRVRAGHFTPEKHIGFEAAAWYWHFVDVVWLFLFFAVYIWGI